MARLYDKKVWLNDQTKLSAKNLNHIEKGIEAVADAVDAVENQLEAFKDKAVIGGTLTIGNTTITEEQLQQLLALLQGQLHN